MEIETIILDIEGTTVPFEFVHSDMFRYVKDHVGHFLNENHDPYIASLTDKIIDEYAGTGNFLKNRDSAGNKSVEYMSEVICKLVDRDSKFGPFKELEGMIWKKGFENGTLLAKVYKDACEKMIQWNEKGKDIFIYSSGSIQSQKLLFSHTEWGDLTPYISGFFDTSMGDKKNPDSYSKILDATGKNGENVLFLSDVEEELMAAFESNINVILVNRDGNDYKKSRNFKIISSFNELDGLYDK